MRMRKSVVVLAAVALFSLSSVGYSKNAHLLRMQNRLASLAQGTKNLLVKNGNKPALLRQLAAGTALGIMVCTTQIGCGGATALQGVAQEQQYVRSPAEIMGREVHFAIEGKNYVGYVVNTISSDKVAIDNFTGQIIEVETNNVLGVRIKDHNDERRMVNVAANEEGQKFKQGLVVAIYDSNFYEILVGGYIDFEDNVHLLEFPEVVITHFDNIAIFGEHVDVSGEEFD